MTGLEQVASTIVVTLCVLPRRPNASMSRTVSRGLLRVSPYNTYTGHRHLISLSSSAIINNNIVQRSPLLPLISSLPLFPCLLLLLLHPQQEHHYYHYIFIIIVTNNNIFIIIMAFLEALCWSLFFTSSLTLLRSVISLLPPLCFDIYMYTLMTFMPSCTAFLLMPSLLLVKWARRWTPWRLRRQRIVWIEYPAFSSGSRTGSLLCILLCDLCCTGLSAPGHHTHRSTVFIVPFTRTEITSGLGPTNLFSPIVTRRTSYPDSYTKIPTNSFIYI